MDKVYIPERPQDERRPMSAARPSAINVEKADGNDGEEAFHSAAKYQQDRFSSENDVVYGDDAYWPSEVRQNGSGKGGGIGESVSMGVISNDEDLRMSADDIRDKLKTLKSRGSSRSKMYKRAASASGQKPSSGTASEAMLEAAREAASNQPSTPNVALEAF